MENVVDSITDAVDTLADASMLQNVASVEDSPSLISRKDSSAKMVPQVVNGKKGLKVLFLSSDTGGGHRASAESLAKQFEELYPGSVYVLHDIQENEGTPPYNNLVKTYKHLSAHPSQWKIVYGVSNSRAFEMIADVHLKLMCERAVRKRIMSYDPDVVISVHPLMCNVPVLSCAKISHKTGKHLPMFTVVTDLGSAHCLWFANGVEKMFVGSQQIYDLAKARGKVPDEKLVIAGLPIRKDFAIQAEKLGDRLSEQGKAYQLQVRADLGLPFVDRKTILVMGGGEGVGSLSFIVNSLFVELTTNGIDALILVVCGRNEKLKNDLQTRNWEEILQRHHLIQENRLLDTSSVCGGEAIFPTFASSKGCIKESGVTQRLRRILSTGAIALDSPVSSAPASGFSAPLPKGTASTSNDSTEDKQVECGAQEVMLKDGTPTPVESVNGSEDGDDSLDANANGSMQKGKPAEKIETKPVQKIQDVIFDEKSIGSVAVEGLGFVTRMAEYMVASDVLVSKAGPGTISEAAALSLPVLLTSFLPGQEEGNVDFVIDGGFGAFVSDSDPNSVADVVVSWLTDEEKMEALSNAAKEKGAPYAARDIVKAIGESTLKWREINEEREAARSSESPPSRN
jgi:UDP-N-acetylglucosamine:LPS N-acetylglucosamine transferase